MSGLVEEMSPVTVWLLEAVGSVADAAPSACATSETRSETCWRDSTPQPSALLVQSLWAAEGAVSLKLV